MKRSKSDSLKVAVIEPVGGHGGMDYYDFSLCEELGEAGADVTLYTCDETLREGPPSFEVSLPYQRIYGADPAWLRGARFVRGTFRALLYAKRRCARIAHFHFFYVGPLELFNVVLARVLGFSLVVTAHDVQAFVERLSVPWMTKAAYKGSDLIIAQSKVGKRELTATLRVPKAKVALIPHGNYLHFIDSVPSREEARSRVGLPDGARVLLFFGQIKEVKGLDVLLRAMPGVVRKYPDAVLLIAGKVWKDDFRHYQEQMDALGIAENCLSSIRYIPDSEVGNYYAAADVVVLPYRRIYQSGVLLMAMSYGKPVVVSDIDGMAEVVEDRVNGYVFPSGDADALTAKLVEVLSEPEELRNVGKRALSYVKERHNWAEIGKVTVEHYRSVLGR